MDSSPILFIFLRYADILIEYKNYIDGLRAFNCCKSHLNGTDSIDLNVRVLCEGAQLNYLSNKIDIADELINTVKEMANESNNICVLFGLFELSLVVTTT